MKMLLQEIAKQKEAPTAGSDFIFTFFADDYLHFVFNLQILQINVNDLLWWGSHS